MKVSSAWLRNASAVFSFASIFGLAGMSSPALADGHLKVHHVFGPDVVLGDRTSDCTNPKKPCVVNVNVTANQKTGLEAWVVYNTETCKVADEGAWTVTTKPKDGSFSTGVYKAPPACGTQKSWKYNAIYYTWTAKKGTKDGGAANWSADYENVQYYEGYKFIFHLTK